MIGGILSPFETINILSGRGINDRNVLYYTPYIVIQHKCNQYGKWQWKQINFRTFDPKRLGHNHNIMLKNGLMIDLAQGNEKYKTIHINAIEPPFRMLKSMDTWETDGLMFNKSYTSNDSYKNSTITM